MSSQRGDPRFAPRLPRPLGLATNIGRAISISAPTAMMVRMIVTLVRNSRAVMKCLPFAILEAESSTRTDDSLIFLSGFAERSAMTHNRICGSLFWGEHAMMRRSRFVVSFVVVLAGVV